jgi:hypothetical protein
MPRSLANQITHLAPWLAHWRARAGEHPYRLAAAWGTCLGIVGTFCALLVGSLVQHFLPPELWGHSAASGLGGLGWFGVFMAAVVYAPLIETLLGQVLPIELLRRLRAGPPAAVLLSALLFGAGHYLNGGLAHGITSFFSGAVFACAYLALRRTGPGPACLAACTAHAVQNGTVLFVIAPLLPG